MVAYPSMTPWQTHNPSTPTPANVLQPSQASFLMVSRSYQRVLIWTKRLEQASRSAIVYTTLKAKADKLQSRLPDPQRRAMELAREKGGSSTLTTIPISEHGFFFEVKSDFHDHVHLRYCWPLDNLPPTCLCGSDFTIDHAQICKLSGFINMRHDDPTTFLAKCMKEAYHDVELEPPLQPLTGETLRHLTANSEPDARADIQGALLDTTDQWHRQLDSGLDICCVFFDYSKAFDSVPHRPLLQKLKNCNVHPHIIRWITHYLCKRSQYVCVNGSSSGVLPVTSGVPQGSVLGPFQFIFYIDDITMVPLSDGTMSLYADDLVLYRPIHSATDYHLLQIDIDNICVWSDDNLLKFNGRKCKYMIITRRKQPSLPVTSLKIKQNFLERVHSYRYLGVWLTSSLNWSMQVSEVCKKARQQVGILYRKFYPSANSSSLLQLYLAYIRPHLEYATPVWDPH